MAKSIFKGDTWTAYRPGEDPVPAFKDSWTTRNRFGHLMACVHSEKELISNAKHCRVKLKWKHRTAVNPARKEEADHTIPVVFHGSTRFEDLAAACHARGLEVSVALIPARNRMEKALKEIAACKDDTPGTIPALRKIARAALRRRV